MLDDNQLSNNLRPRIFQDLQVYFATKTLRHGTEKAVPSLSVLRSIK